MLPEIAFWTSTGVLAWVYAGYPLAAGLLGRVRPVVLRATSDLPTLTVAIAVHDEAEHIAERVADALAQAGPGAPLIEVLV
ncbi:MAG: hypothetical protein QOG32_1559, partial [Chloroflexota bacterium]|nr:hypothetical protein [Chloroflexota bacterium]